MTHFASAGREPFSVWLRNQAGRQDPVGDLAQDFVLGVDMGLHDGDFETPKLFKRQVLDVVGGDVWRDAYRQARDEFKAAGGAG